MHVQRVTPVLNVSDIAASLAWFTALGWQRSFTWNAAGTIAGAADANAHGPADFAGIRNFHAEIFLCRDGQGGRGETGAWMSWWMNTARDVDTLYAKAGALGCPTDGPPRNEPWGVREFHLHHPDGHVFRISAGADE